MEQHQTLRDTVVLTSMLGYRHTRNIGHSRKNMDSIIYCIEKVINRKTAEWLFMPLPSTRLPSHYWSAADKGTPSRVTSQAVLIVSRDQNGTPSPIPVAAPEIYFDFHGAS